MSYDFLSQVPGVIHVGANIGQERQLYAQHGLRVIWVEPIPDVFRRLTENIKPFPSQRAFQALLTDEDDKPYPFYISNNDGRSSSILDIHLHEQIWPQVFYQGALELKSATLSSLLSREHLNVSDYPALVMDTQGSELLVLKGAERLLPQFRYIKTEVADFEAYRDCCTLEQMSSYLADRGFKEFIREPFAGRTGVGTYFDVTYVNTSPAATQLAQ